MSKTRLKIAKPDIVNFFEDSSIKVFKRSDIDIILRENRAFWRLAQGTTTYSFIQYLKDETNLLEHRFEFPGRTEIRYTWGRRSIYETILTVRPNSYFTHFTAMSIHQLTEQIPKTVYLNYEQAAKRIITRELQQDRIDRAFKASVRTSKTTAEIEDRRICLLNGKFTNQLGVIEVTGDFGENIRVTDIERTLIDITVRPIYSGGVHEVLNAYRLAQDKVSVNKLTSLLKKIDYIYPYHQAIAFYLEKAGGYKETQLNLLRKFDVKYDFYLTHNMKETAYSKKWRLFFPKGL